MLSFPQVMGLPQAMQSFTLTFVADDVTLFTDSFSYGASFGSDIFPQIPAKDGYHAQWDREDLTDLHFDTIVTAVYTYVPGLASQGPGRTAAACSCWKGIMMSIVP